METRQSSVETNNSNDKLDLAKTVRIMDRLRAAEIFATPEMSKEFLDSLSFEDFIRWTNFVSGIETGTSIDEREIGSSSFIESYSNVTKTTRCSYLPPFAQYRVPLFKKAFEKAQEIDDPKTAGLTLSFAINTIHPYDDGNGRTGRIIYSLLSRGYSGSNEDREYYSSILQNLSGRKSINPNSVEAGLNKEIINEYFEEIRSSDEYKDFKPITHVSGAYRYDNGNWVSAGDEKIEYLMTPPNSSGDDRRRLHYVMQEEKFSIVPVLKTFSADRVIPFTTIRSPEFDDGTTYIDGKRFLSSLSSEEINNLFEQAISMKNNFVERIINFSDRPDAEKYISKFN